MPAIGPILETIGSLTQRIRDYERELETISREHYPETELLRQVEGIGPLTALTFVLTLEDPYRFEKSRSVGAYLGLVPASDQSADRDPQRHISKEGDEMLRKLLVGSAHYILGPFGSDSDLRACANRDAAYSVAKRAQDSPSSGEFSKLPDLKEPTLCPPSNHTSSSPSGNSFAPCCPRGKRIIRSVVIVPVYPIGWSSRSLFRYWCSDAPTGELPTRSARPRRSGADATSGSRQE
jgi:hypothetical protein